MLGCNFSRVLNSGKVLQANSPQKSHAELDESETLDAGNKDLLAKSYVELDSLLPDLRVIGGCCGTEHTHIEKLVVGLT